MGNVSHERQYIEMRISFALFGKKLQLIAVDEKNCFSECILYLKTAILASPYDGVNTGKYFKLHVILTKFKSRLFVIVNR